jgi:hypothetical protein
MLKTSSVVPSPNRQKSKNCARAPVAPYGSAIKAWPSGQIMATPMITRRGGYPVRYAKPGASARLAARAQPPAITSRSSIASPGIETNRCQARGRKRTRRCLALHSANFGIDDGGAGLRLRHADFAKVIKRGDYKVFLRRRAIAAALCASQECCELRGARAYPSHGGSDDPLKN